MRLGNISVWTLITFLPLFPLSFSIQLLLCFIHFSFELVPQTQWEKIYMRMLRKHSSKPFLFPFRKYFVLGIENTNKYKNTWKKWWKTKVRNEDDEEERKEKERERGREKRATNKVISWLRHKIRETSQNCESILLGKYKRKFRKCIFFLCIFLTASWWSKFNVILKSIFF